ncbi:hypothetical protein I4U23_016906 [Adineta vaga]|nr:hypothetical protein I4U23_016906 [Adineta vaga]
MAEKSEPLIKRTNEVGRGGFGIVYRGLYNGSQVVAIKDIAAKLSADALVEANLLKILHHPYIVRFIDVITTITNTSLITEYVDGGSLADYIQKTIRQTVAYWKAARQIMLDVAYGMSYLHEKRVVHADLKSFNILLRRDKRAVICDFGLAKTRIDSKAQTTGGVAGTVRWFAPELCLDRPERHSFPSDVWAFGCVLLELITKKVPWADQYQMEIVLLVALSKPNNAHIFQNICQTQRAPEKLRTALCRCCAWSKADRPSFPTIVSELASISEEDLRQVNEGGGGEEEKPKQPKSSNVQQSTSVGKRSTKGTSSISIANDNSTSEDGDHHEIERKSSTNSTQHKKYPSQTGQASAYDEPPKNVRGRRPKVSSSSARSKNNSDDAQHVRNFFEQSTMDCFLGGKSDPLEIAFGLHRKGSSSMDPFAEDHDSDD